MKLILTFISLFLLNTICSAQVLINDTRTESVFSVKDSSGEIPHVNLDDLQFIFSTLVSDIVDNYDYVENGYFNIDQDYTDLGIGKFKFSLSATTTPLKWNTAKEPQVVNFSANMETNVDVDQETSNKIVSVSGSINLKTNIMALLKQVSLTFGECELVPDEEIETDDDRLANVFCAALIGINESTTIKELKPHFDHVVEKAKEFAENQEEANENLVKILEALMVTETETGIKLSTVININAFNIKTDELLLTIEEDSMTLSFSGTADLPEEDFNKYLTDLNLLLAEIVDYENNDDSIYYVIDSYAFIIFDLLEGFLVPETAIVPELFE